MGQTLAFVTALQGLNSRQESLLFWTGVLVIFGIIVSARSENGMGSIIGLLKTLIQPLILVPIVIVVIWNFAVLWMLQRVGYWDETMLWDTVTYVLFGGIGSLVMASNATFNGAFFRRSILKNSVLLFFVGFIMNLFTLGWVEFLLIPFLFVIAGLIAVAGNKPENRSVLSFIGGIQLLTGGSLLVFTVTHLISQYRKVATMHTIAVGALPVVLSLAFTPLLFMLCIWIAYSDAFIPLRLARAMDLSTKRYAKKKVILKYGLRLPAVQRFRAAKGWGLVSAQSRGDVDLALQD